MKILKRLKRGPQVILPKDFGTIVSETGCKSGWKVVDAGTGSGFLAVMLGNLGCKVSTYEKDERFYRLAKENIKKSGLKNVRIKNKDVTKGIYEKNLDMITLDMKNPEKVIGNAYKKLKRGGFLVIYSMHIEQVQEVGKELKNYKFKTKILENIQREWQIEGETFTRPKSKMMGHTGFLIISRKL